MPTRSPEARLLALPENRAALAACRNVLHALTSGTEAALPNPLFVHGPSGSGKTTLVQTLEREVHHAGFDCCALSSNDFAEKDVAAHAIAADLLILEDVHHLPVRFFDSLIRILDTRLRHDWLMIFTALEGPAQLAHRGTAFPRRLANRLAGGLVVAVEPLQRRSRRRLLEEMAANAGVLVSADILDWLADHQRGGGRQLSGAIQQLKTLQRLQRKKLGLDEVRRHFAPLLGAETPTVQEIAEQVSACFRVPSKQLLSTRRTHDVLLPRQISMYLARRLTKLSLEQIGEYFGGRDYKTVQHACNKVEAALKTDAALSSTVRQLRAVLA